MRFAFLLGAAALFGCSSAPQETFTASFPSTVVPAGMEKTQCVILHLGNTEKVHIGQIHNQLGDASHHMIVYRVSDTVEQPTPFDCEPFVDTLDPAAGSPLMITQRADELLELPQGVAFSLEPNQMIRLEMHYINYSPEPIDISATAEFIPIPDAEFQHEADFLFIGNPDIDLAPRTTATLGPTYFQLPAEFDASRTYHYRMPSLANPKAVLLALLDAGIPATRAWQPLDDRCFDPIGPTFTVKLEATGSTIQDPAFELGVGRLWCATTLIEYTVVEAGS